MLSSSVIAEDMPPAHAVFVEADFLLSNRNADAPLGPCDGRVAAIHPRFPDYYIATPNKDNILAPPGPCKWPQPFSQSAPYLCCIPKREAQEAGDSIMWWNPTYQDFEPTICHDGCTGIGFLPHHKLRSMEQCCERLNHRVDEYQEKISPTEGHPVISPLSMSLRRSLSRLRAVAMTRREALFECRQVQRQWMELRALMEQMDYIEIYEPRMEGGVRPAKETANVIGCFVQEVHVAERLFSAGIPYWLICPISTFSNENILSITTVVQPKDVLTLDDHFMPFPRIYVGESNYNRFRAISKHGLKSLCYKDLFSDGNRQQVRLPESTRRTITQPSRGSRNTGARSRQYPQHHGQSGPSVNRDKFNPINSPYMSLYLQPWQTALGAVDRSPEMLFSQTKLADNNGKYPFPEPGIFCSGDAAERRNRFLTVWTAIRDVCIYRISSNAPDIQLLSNQQWRTLLGGRPAKRDTKAGASREALALLLSPEVTEMGVDISNLHNIVDREFTVREAQENMWGISELSFRFELLMLDRRALDRRLFADRPQELSSLVREELVLNCFYFRPDQPRHLTSVSVRNARQGLASPYIRDRLPYLNALRLVMLEWVGFNGAPDPASRLNTPTAEDDIGPYEYSLARFYTQTYFRHFGRAAVVPATLPDC